MMKISSLTILFLLTVPISQSQMIYIVIVINTFKKISPLKSPECETQFKFEKFDVCKIFDKIEVVATS
jgi:hypothetical protein